MVIPDELRLKLSALDSALRPIYGPLSDLLVSRFFPFVQGAVVLDLGGGTGQWVNALASRGIKLGIILDPEGGPLLFLRERQRESRVEDPAIFPIQGFAQNIPLKPVSVDLIVSRNSMHLWENILQGWMEMFRILKPGGVAFIGRGFGPTLPPEIRKEVKEKRKNILLPIRKEPDSPTIPEVEEMIREAGFSRIEVIPDGKSYWVGAFK